MANLWRKNSPILSRIVFDTFIVGLLVVVLGVVLVQLGAMGNTEFSFFGQTFKSTNIGIAVIFLGVAVIVLIIYRILESYDRTVQSDSALQVGTKAEGDLLLSDILVRHDEEAKTCTLDFRVQNAGGSDVSISRVRLKVLSVKSAITGGFMEFSKRYDLDISDLRQKGDEAELAISQVVEPGRTDRFGIILVASKMGTGEFRKWLLEPSLVSGQSAVIGPEVEIQLPSEQSAIFWDLADRRFMV